MSLARTCEYVPGAARMRCEPSADGNRADRSAPAEIKALARTGDAQLLHFRLKGGPFHGQTSRGAVWSPENPAGFAEDADDVIAFGVGKRDNRAVRRLRRSYGR